MQPYPGPQSQTRPEVAVERVVDDAEEDKKLQKVLYALTDLIRTPSDHAQLRAINAIENLAQKGILIYFCPYLVVFVNLVFRVECIKINRTRICPSYSRFIEVQVH